MPKMETLIQKQDLSSQLQKLEGSLQSAKNIALVIDNLFSINKIEEMLVDFSNIIDDKNLVINNFEEGLSKLKSDFKEEGTFDLVEKSRIDNYSLSLARIRSEFEELEERIEKIRKII